MALRKSPKKVKFLDPSFDGKRYSEKTLVQSDEIDEQKCNDESIEYVTYVCMTQFSMKSGIKNLGQDSNDAIMNELKQLHMCNTFSPVDPSHLTKEQKEQVLESHLFLKLKRDDTIKGRLVAGGDKQRAYMDKEQLGSPTACL